MGCWGGEGGGGDTEYLVWNGAGKGRGGRGSGVGEERGAGREGMGTAGEEGEAVTLSAWCDMEQVRGEGGKWGRQRGVGRRG